MPSLIVNIAVFAEIGAANGTHQNRCHAHLACFVDEAEEVLLIGGVRLCSAHVGQRVFAFCAELGVLHIDILTFAFLIVMGELDNEVVAGFHLLLDRRPEVVGLIERTGGSTRFAAVVDFYRVGVKKRLQIHSPAALRRCGRLVFAHGTVADRVYSPRSRG